MGLVESKLNTKTVKPLVSVGADAALPHFLLDSAKFVDDTVGFVMTHIDIAKNHTTTTHVINNMITVSESQLMFTCTDNSSLVFLRDTANGSIYCIVNRANGPMSIVRRCVTTYENLGDETLDAIGKLYKTSHTV
jgi:hypothetical protein